jgi:hypothetical protein
MNSEMRENREHYRSQTDLARAMYAYEWREGGKYKRRLRKRSPGAFAPTKA